VAQEIPVQLAVEFPDGVALRPHYGSENQWIE
jgi:hypothetical protein